jgi:hypothetical protein
MSSSISTRVALQEFFRTYPCSDSFRKFALKHPDKIARLYCVEHPELMGRDWTRKIKAADPQYTYSSTVRRALRKAYRKNMGLFDLYEDLKNKLSDRTSAYNPEDDDGRLPSEIFESEMRRLVVRKEKAEKKALRVHYQRLKVFLERMEKESFPSKVLVKKVNTVYIDLISVLCRQADVYVKAQTKGNPGWASFRKMSEQEEETARLKHENPDLYEKIMEERELRKEIEEAIEKQIVRDGLIPTRTMLYGSVVQVGKDVRTSMTGVAASDVGAPEVLIALDEDREVFEDALSRGLRVDVKINNKTHRVAEVLPEGKFLLDPPLAEESSAFEYTASIYEELVYDKDGDVIGVDDFIKERKRHLSAMRKLQRVFPEDLEDLRKYPEADLDALLEGREVTYAALTDDIAKQKPVTRILPCVEIFGERVISEGRFKGFVLDDMINANGRQIEGTAYDYDPKLRRPVSLETHMEDGTLKVELPANREPYMTVDGDGRLYLKIPSTREFTHLRNAVRGISKETVDVEYVEGTRNSVFKFDPSQFMMVRDALASMAMSKSAMELVQDHFEKQREESQEAAYANIHEFDADLMGGFKEGFDFFNKQKHAMAWLEQRGNSGLLALDTGVGKSLTSVGYLKNIVNQADVELEPNSILFVCPANLRGNLEHEVRQRLKDPEPFLMLIETMSYAQFSREDEDVMDRYYAVVFDEAHNLASLNSKRARNAMRPHPRKMLMTASPMENDVMDVRILAGIANNEDLLSKEGKQRVREFRDRFTERIGGRTVGVKQDASLKEAMQDWVQGNVFFAHKLDIEEYDLKKLETETRTVMMDADTEEEYRRAADEVKTVLEGMVRRYRDRDQTASDSEIDAAIIKLAGHFKTLGQIVNLPRDGQPSPKVIEASNIIRERVESRGRTMLWTDDPEVAEATARDLSRELPGTDHVAGLSGEIQVWRNGEKVKSYTPRNYTFGEQSYDRTNWRMGVVNHVLKPSLSIVSATLTSAYTTGMNLQEFDTIVHLDRDSWSSEDMKQRTARAYRQGQDKQCREITLDTVFESRQDDLDLTLDEIRGVMQNMEADLFDKVIVESQSKATGKEFFAMDQIAARSIHLDRKIFEHVLSPYIKNAPDSTT